jgi:hypothetical protein
MTKTLERRFSAGRAAARAGDATWKWKSLQAIRHWCRIFGPEYFEMTTRPGLCARAQITTRRLRARPILLALALAGWSSSTYGQTVALSEQPLLGTTLTGDLLRDLPTTNNPFAVLENLQTEVIGDRVSSGGMNIAPVPRFGSFLNSWTQTQFRIGDIPITDPRTGGVPLLSPILPLWERMAIVTGAMGLDENASALAVTLEPRRPGPTWFRTVEASFSAPALVADRTSRVPDVDGVREMQDGNVVIGGPMSDRVGLVAAGSWRRLSHVAARNTSATSDRLSSGFAHLVFSATPQDEVRTIGWVQRMATATFTDTVMHAQSTWERRNVAQAGWRVFGGYTRLSRTAPITSTLVVDSLTSDPVSGLFDTGAGTTRRWVLGARAAPRATRPLPTIGVDLERAQVRATSAGLEQIRELVDGVPSRMWTYHAGAGTDERGLTTFALFANEHVTLGRLTADAGLRLDTTSGAAEASAQGIDWTTWLPSGRVRWQITETAGLALIGSYRRTAYQLPLNVLALGDTAAPFADVSIWNGTSTGPLIARVGPGTGGDPTLVQVDPQLKRPTTDEFVLSFESRLRPGLYLGISRITKREQPLFGFVDVGVPPSEFTAFQVPDLSFEPGSPDGGPLVTVYNRPPASYGRDRYLLTNQAGDPAKSWGVEFTIRASTDRFTLLGAGALTWARGPAAAVGFLPTENDQDVLPNLFVDPNAATDARGQLFPDRSHVAKLAGTYQFPWRLRLGAIARYQDGQPFARVVIVPDLTQGTTPVRGYPNGGTAFTYTGTLDIRVQKAFTAGRAQVDVRLDVYNLPNMGKEVSEYVVSGPLFRTPTALQPSRTALVGARVTF